MVIWIFSVFLIFVKKICKYLKISIWLGYILKYFVKCWKMIKFWVIIVLLIFKYGKELFGVF